jgi:hypothetical protein
MNTDTGACAQQERTVSEINGELKGSHVKQASGRLREAALRFCFASMIARCRRKLLVKSAERSTKLRHSKTMMRPGSMPSNVSECCRAPAERNEWSTKLLHSNDDETGVDAVQRLNKSCLALAERKAAYVYMAHSKRNKDPTSPS